MGCVCIVALFILAGGGDNGNASPFTARKIYEEMEVNDCKIRATKNLSRGEISQLSKGQEQERNAGVSPERGAIKIRSAGRDDGLAGSRAD